MITFKTAQRFFSGDIVLHRAIRKQFPLIGLIAALLFLLTLSRYHAGTQQQRYTRLKNEVKELRYEYLTISAQEASLTRQSEVSKALRERGSKLEPNNQPLIRVR